MKILGIDTSCARCSVCVYRDDAPIYTAVESAGAARSKNLMPMISRALDACGMSPGDIDLYAVTLGPGSFTGIRIGIAAVKGMASYADTPCVGVSSLKALAACRDFDGIVIPAFDARRRQVYACRMDGDRVVKEEFCRDVGALEETVKNAGKKVIFVGDGRSLCYNEYKDYPNVKKSRDDLPCIALGACRIAAAERALGHTVTHFELSPSYLRLSQAERELKERTANSK